MARWKCLSEWKDDALPEFGPFETDELKEGMVFWDLRLTNYAHDLFAALVQGKGQWRIKLLYTLAPHQALVRQGRVSEGQVADTHTSWIQLHGTGVRPALMALGGNLLCTSEIQRGKVAPEQDMKTNLEIVAGRGVYT